MKQVGQTVAHQDTITVNDLGKQFRNVPADANGSLSPSDVQALCCIGMYEEGHVALLWITKRFVPDACHQCPLAKPLEIRRGALALSGRLLIIPIRWRRVKSLIGGGLDCPELLLPQYDWSIFPGVEQDDSRCVYYLEKASEQVRAPCRWPLCCRYAVNGGRMKRDGS